MGRSPLPPGDSPTPAPSPRPSIPLRRPLWSLMLTLLLFSLSFREKKRRRIEELLAEKLVLPGGRGPLRRPPPPFNPRPRGPAAAGPGSGRGAPGAGRAASPLTLSPSGADRSLPGCAPAKALPGGPFFLQPKLSELGPRGK